MINSDSGKKGPAQQHMTRLEREQRLTYERHKHSKHRRQENQGANTAKPQRSPTAGQTNENYRPNRDLDRQDSGFTEEQLLEIMAMDGRSFANFLQANGIDASTAALFAKHGITGRLGTIVQENVGIVVYGVSDTLWFWFSAFVENRGDLDFMCFLVL